jgi:hypothetical protein
VIDPRINIQSRISGGNRCSSKIRSASGAPQESDESCGPLFRSAFPEVLKATTQLGTAESDDSVGALNSPVHSGSFEPRADGYFAPGLYNARGSTKPCAWKSG